MKLGCRDCPERDRCRALCEGAVAYVDQDGGAGRREPLVADLVARSEDDLGEGFVGALSADVWSDGPTVFRVGDREVDAQAARVALARLTAVERRRARLRWVRRLSETQIAEREGVSVVAVSRSLARCVDRLRAALESPRRRGRPRRPPSGRRPEVYL